MALTSNSDIFGSFNESAFNTIIREIMEQRPYEFNYASHDVAKFRSFCSPIKVNPVLESMGIKNCTIVDKLSLIGSNDPALGVDFCVQLKEFKIDFQPSNQIVLPVELGNLVLQEFSLKGTVCAGINCGGRINRKKPERKLADIKLDRVRGLQFFPFERLNMMCFCLSIYAKVVLVQEGKNLQLRLVGIEIEDISPLGLENSIECYLKQMLDNVVFPKMKLAIGDLVFNAGSYFTLGLTPVSPAVPFNPSISNDQLSVFINLI
jgi:hypothetical protein